jgi:hypothetical protein
LYFFSSIATMKLHYIMIALALTVEPVLCQFDEFDFEEGKGTTGRPPGKGKSYPPKGKGMPDPVPYTKPVPVPKPVPTTTADTYPKPPTAPPTAPPYTKQVPVPKPVPTTTADPYPKPLAAPPTAPPYTKLAPVPKPVPTTTADPDPKPLTAPPTAPPYTKPVPVHKPVPTTTADPDPKPPTAPPTAPPTSKPTASFANMTNETFKLADFKGISNAYSLNKGIINIDWDASFFELGNVSFDVFVALGEYDYKLCSSVDCLVGVFTSEPTFQHYKVTETNEISVETPYFGEKHSLLVTAQVGGEYSTNTRSKAIVASRSDYHIRDEVNVVGVFFPTSRLVIKMDDVSDGMEHSLSFIGPVSTHAQNLTVGDFITGFTSEFDPFARRILEIIENNSSSVVLRVVNARIEDIFDELDLDSSFEVSRTGPVSGRRRLFDFGVGWVRDNIVKPIDEKVIRPIGDAVTDAFTEVADWFEDIAEFVVNGQFEEKFSVVNIDKKWDFKVDAGETVTGDNTTILSLDVKGYAKVDVSLNAKLRINYASIGVTAEYATGSTLTASAGKEREYEKTVEVFKGQRFSKIFMVGPVPVELYAQPSITLEAKASASLIVEAEVGFAYKGGTSIGAAYDNGAVKDEIVAPYNEFDPIWPTVEGTAKFDAGVSLVLNVEAGFYAGLASATIGLRLGLDLKVAVSITSVDNLPTVNDFDVGLGAAIPLSAKFFYGEKSLGPLTVWEKRWTIITLPSVNFVVLDDHRCVFGNNGAVASFSLKAEPSYPGDALFSNPVESRDWSRMLGDGWSVVNTSETEAYFERTGLELSSPQPFGTVTFAMQPRFPPLFKVIETVSLDSLFPADSVQCTNPAPCDGDQFFDKLTQSVGAEFNSNVFLSQPPDPNASKVPSSVYKFEDFMTALKKLQSAGEGFQFWLGDDCSNESLKAALVNMAAFLGQAMQETIIYDACDENNWDKWRADIFKEPSSPPENLAALYPMSSGCGQLGQKYAEYSCDDECPQDVSMEKTATTNAAWIGAPPPLFCGPRSTYDGLGYWNPQQFCNGTDKTCVGEPFYYEGQTAGVHVPVSEDDRFPAFFYSNPLPDADGSTPEPRSDSFPATNVEGCCWWGRGVIQTTGRCNFGRLNKQIGAGAGPNALYPSIDFCRDPQAICTGPSDLKWISGIFFWVSETQSYNRDGYNFIDGIKDFVALGCAEVDTDPNRTDCNLLFESASGIVNRGCHNPSDGGCPNCQPGATCDPAHNVPERVSASKLVLRTLLKYMAITVV